MSEEQPPYDTETADALEMLGKGYDQQPAAIIESPRKVTALRDKGLVEYQVWGWVKMSANFIKHIKLLKGAKLSVWNTIALSIDESGKCNLSVSEIASLTDYSASEVRQTIKELDEMGYLSVVRSDGKKNIYNPEFVARSSNTPTTDPSRKTTPPVDCTPLVGKGKRANNPSSPSEENSIPSIKRVKRVNTANNQMTAILGFEVMAQRLRNAQIEFESQIGFNPAWSKPDWEKQCRKIADLLEKTPNILKDFSVWRKGEGKYQGLTNGKMAQTPNFFMDVAYPTFLASTDMKGGISQPVTVDEDGFPESY